MQTKEDARADYIEKAKEAIRFYDKARQGATEAEVRGRAWSDFYAAIKSLQDSLLVIEREN